MIETIELAQTLAKILCVSGVRIESGKVFVTAYKGAKEAFFTTVADANNRLENGVKGCEFAGLSI